MVMILLILAWMILNGFGFLLMGWDKAQAMKRKWRVRESVFFLLSFFGGAVGVWMGMKAFRHKTLHRSFRIGVPLFVAWNLFFLYVLWEII
jgi:uncharacterized membrane protein YsdA (DUF1294 family)